jgi:hypothetical protein
MGVRNDGHAPSIRDEKKGLGSMGQTKPPGRISWKPHSVGAPGKAQVRSIIQVNGARRVQIEIGKRNRATINVAPDAELALRNLETHVPGRIEQNK